jgi:integrase/recombinase XerD
MRSSTRPNRGGRGGLNRRSPAELRPSRREAQSPSTAFGLVRRLGRQTARLWRGLSYDDAIAVAAAARRELGLERPQKRKRVVARLTRPELEQLLGHAYRLRGDRGLLVKTLVLTGARVSEFVAIDIRDFSYDDKTITIRHGKGRKERVVPILPALADELQVHVHHASTGPLFHSRRWRLPFSQRRVQQIVKELAAGAGIVKRVYPHLMRHSVAQHLLEGGMPLEQVQRFLGHSSITTTQIYAESSAAMIRDSYRKALG